MITSNYIGTTVTLSNSAIACQEWIIADVNHDNTSGTVDLISKYTLTNGVVKFSDITSIYSGSNLNTYLESTVYNGFSSSIKSALDNMNVVSNGTTIQRHVVAPSLKEVGVNATGKFANYYIEEGTIYPIFSPASNRNIKSIRNTPSGEYADYWTRSRCTFYTTGVWYVGGHDGVAGDSNCDNSRCVVARIRFAKA